jgi:hypothetical protein
MEGGPEYLTDVVIPAPEELPAVLLNLAVPHEDIDPIIAGRPSADRWPLLEACLEALATGAELPAVPEEPYFHVYAFLAALPRVTAYHRQRGIPPEVTRLTLADLGRALARHRWQFGLPGLDLQHWLTAHFTGRLYQLGRLQFERAGIGTRTGRAAGLAPGTPVLGVHIPHFFGPLSPAACDGSFARAVEFFARHFPEERYEVAVCNSWLLDPQLAGYLPADSNIVRFQRRFQPAYTPDADDETIQEFVFGRAEFDPALLPRDTALQRAVADHLLAGRHWHGGAGWLRLKPPRQLPDGTVRAPEG